MLQKIHRRKNKLLKRFFLSLLMSVVSYATVCGGEEILKFTNDGMISVTGNIQNTKAQSDVSLVITKRNFIWNDSEIWLNENNASNIVYYGNGTVNSDGDYEFNIYLNNDGEYTGFLYNEGLEEEKIFYIQYTNTERNSLALEILKEEVLDDNNPEDIKNILKNDRYSLALFSKLYDEEKLLEVSEIIAEYLEENTGFSYDGEETEKLINRGFLVVNLKEEQIVDIDMYINEIYKSDSFVSFYNPLYSKEMTEKLMENSYSDISEFDEAFEEIIILSAINNNDGTQELKDILKYLGISEKSGLVKKISEKEDFKSLKQFKDFCENYTVNSNNEGNGGGGGSAPKNTKPTVQADKIYSGNTYAVTEEKETEDDVIFLDVPADFWGENAIEALYHKGIVNGKGNNMFYPDDTVTREEFVKMVVEAFNLKLVGDDVEFNDVSKDSWAYPYIKIAYLAHLVQGVGNNEFGFGRNITRQDIAVILNNSINELGIRVSDTREKITFSDDGEISDYAKAAVTKLQTVGVISGYNNKFMPTGKATRAEAAQMIYNFLNCKEN